ncbi:3-beta hydroxysteroid dehydrogenase isomerase family protein [Phlyctema vagabunda]|uniref:3-beta hydroxysteroid dehydrogenase isomerase family protein n=1 Tax=Phlyctema vagabunda TaxID=108571 RepID=A0ABR4P4H5_9HELO
MAISYVLVTGATGLVGAHVVDQLLDRGFRVRAVARSRAKAKAMQDARQKYASHLDFYFIDDLTTPDVFDKALRGGIDGVIHVASPFNYSVLDNENELMIPAISGVRSLLSAALATGGIQRVVLTSSFAAVLDINRNTDTDPWIYTSKDWNPITYAEAASPAATPQVGYRGSKKFAELEAWQFMERESPPFDLVTLCPAMVFGPVANPITSVKELNESNKVLWNVASGVKPLPLAAVNFWIDVRDLANVHVTALLTPQAGGKRYIPVSPAKFTYQLVADIIRDEFPDLKYGISTDAQKIKKGADVDQSAVTEDLKVSYRTLRDTVVEFVRQAQLLDK